MTDSLIGSIVGANDVTSEQFKEVASAWVDIEDDIDVSNTIVEEEMDLLDSNSIANLATEDEIESEEECEAALIKNTIPKVELFKAIEICREFANERQLPRVTKDLIHSFEMAVRSNLLDRTTAMRSIMCYLDKS